MRVCNYYSEKLTGSDHAFLPLTRLKPNTFHPKESETSVSSHILTMVSLPWLIGCFRSQIPYLKTHQINFSISSKLKGKGESLYKHKPYRCIILTMVQSICLIWLIPLGILTFIIKWKDQWEHVKEPCCWSMQPKVFKPKL